MASNRMPIGSLGTITYVTCSNCKQQSDSRSAEFRDGEAFCKECYIVLNKVTKADYDYSLNRVALSKEFWDKHATGKNMRSMPTALAAQDPATNLDRERVEVYTFENLDGGAQGYMAYWKVDEDIQAPQLLTTFTGAPIALVTQKKAYVSKGATISHRVAFRALGIDGRQYAGTWYKSSGDYVRMKPLKLKPLTKPDYEKLTRLYANPNRTLVSELTMRHLNRRAGMSALFVP